MPTKIYLPTSNSPADITWKEINVPGKSGGTRICHARHTNQPYDLAQLTATSAFAWGPIRLVGVYQRDIIEIPPLDVIYTPPGRSQRAFMYYLNRKREFRYSEDSKKSGRFLINNYVKTSKNIALVKIFRWSTGSYLECPGLLAHERYWTMFICIHNLKQPSKDFPGESLPWMTSYRMESSAGRRFDQDTTARKACN